MKKVVAVLLCASLPVQGDVLLDLMYLNHNHYSSFAGVNMESNDESMDADIDIHGSDPEWYSWNLGTNDSLPELVIIVDPYGRNDDW